MTRSGSPSAAEQERQRVQRRKDRMRLIIAGAVIVLLAVGGTVGYQVWRANRMPSAGPEVAETLTSVPIAAGEPVRLGAADAPRTLTAYVDFHCPGCAAFEEDYGPAIFEAQHGGQIAIEVYPLSFHDAGSVAAANGFACAAEAGFGKAYYRGLFTNRDLDWNDNQLIDLSSRVAEDVPASFEECVAARTHAGWLESITAAGDRAGVEQTPTVLLDGDPVDLSETTPERLIAMFEQAATR